MCTIKSSGGYVSSAWTCFESVTFSSESLPGTVLTFNQHQTTLSCHVLEQGVLKLLELNDRQAWLLVKLSGIVICESWGNSVHHKPPIEHCVTPVNTLWLQQGEALPGISLVMAYANTFWTPFWCYSAPMLLIFKKKFSCVIFWN